MFFSYQIDDSWPLINYSPLEGWHQGWEGDGDPASGEYWSNTKTWTNSGGASATFRFFGSNITILGSNRENHGEYTVKLNRSIVSTNNGYYDISNSSGLFQTPLHRNEDLPLAVHEITITNGGEGKYLDIDCIEWSGNDNGDLVNETRQDTSHDFTWGPRPDSWSTKVSDVSAFSNQSGHATNSSQSFMAFTFTGVAVDLIGSIGPNHTQNYSVRIDNDSETQTFSARKDLLKFRVLLYRAASLNPGSHTVHLLNNDDGILEIDHAHVWALNDLDEVSTGMQRALIAIVSIIGVVVIIGLCVTIWFLNRRNKALWSHLTKGYMVQSLETSADYLPVHSHRDMSETIPGPVLGRTQTLRFHENPRNQERHVAPPTRSNTAMTAVTASTLVAENGMDASLRPSSTFLSGWTPKKGGRRASLGNPLRRSLSRTPLLTDEGERLASSPTPMPDDDEPEEEPTARHTRT